MTIALRIAALALFGMAGAVQAADLTPLPHAIAPEQPAAFSFEGLYIGATAGMGWTNGGSGSYGTVGIVAGGHVAIVEDVLIGAELQVSRGYYDGMFDGSEWLALAHAGFVAGDLFMYAAAGGGQINQAEDAVAFGAGAEYAISDNIAIRGEVLRLFEPGGDNTAIKANTGVMFHF